MKLFTSLFFVLIFFSYSCTGALPDGANRWTEVHDVSFITDHAKTSKRGVFMFDADETLFTTAVVDGSPTLVLLYQKLKEVLALVRESGHSIYILTYNTEEEIRRKLIAVGLDVNDFDGILACGMKGDLMTAKGELFRQYVFASKTPIDFVVFIDNFPPFVKNMQSVAQELGVPIYPYVCTGYIDLYHRYVYYHLSKLEKDLAAGADVRHELSRINNSLIQYGIDIARFTKQYPDFDSFKRFAVERALIWPYLTYR